MQLSHRGFALTAGDGVPRDVALCVVDRVLGTPGDRLQFVLRESDLPTGWAGGKIFVKAEFLRPSDALGKRFRASRARCEAAGYAAFRAAGLRVPALLVHGEQSRWKPRAGALVATAKVDAENASAALQRRLREDLVAEVAAALGGTHGKGLLHGDAAIRNFLPAEGGAVIVDLPRWGRWSADGAEEDLSQCLGSALKAGALRAWIPNLFQAYRGAAGDAAARLPSGWEERVIAAAEAYCAYLVARDGTRRERRAKRDSALLRSRPRT